MGATKQLAEQYNKHGWEEEVEHYYAVRRAIALLRKTLAENPEAVEWRIEPHWTGWFITGDPQDPLFNMPSQYSVDEKSGAITQVIEHYQFTDWYRIYGDPEDYEWLKGLVAQKRDELAPDWMKERDKAATGAER